MHPARDTRGRYCGTSGRRRVCYFAGQRRPPGGCRNARQSIAIRDQPTIPCPGAPDIRRRQRRACADAAKWTPHVKLAVNLSPLQFRTGNLFLTVKQALEQSGISPERLELEITEAVLLEKVDHILATLHALRALGVSISMDDFGT